MDLKKYKDFDFILFIIVFFLFSIGLILISSATGVNEGGSYKRLIIQSASYILGIFFIIFFMFFDYNDFKNYEKQLYILGIGLLLLVYVPGLGKAQFGARSWIDLKIIDFQPIELVKLTFILGYAKYLEERKDMLHDLKEIFFFFFYPFPIIILVMLQPDLGGAIVFSFIIFGMLYISGLNLKVVLYAILGALVCSPIIYNYILRPHQRTRIDAFLNPGDPSFEGNFQVIQSMIAIGSGKIFGKGLFNGTQNQYGFLPVTDSDFIFAVLGEEFGLIGMSVVLILYFVFFKRLYALATSAKDFYGTLIIVGITSMFLYQFVQNVGMTMGVMPVTGVTLPFVSYGGSSMLTSMMALALVFNVSVKRRKINF